MCQNEPDMQLPRSPPCEIHLINALHPALLQVRLGTQEVGVLRVVHRLLKVNVDPVRGASCGN